MDEVKQELKRRSKESRALEKKRGTKRMTRIENSRNQIDYETTLVRTRWKMNEQKNLDGTPAEHGKNRKRA